METVVRAVVFGGPGQKHVPLFLGGRVVDSATFGGARLGINPRVWEKVYFYTARGIMGHF